jgi:hypothetical protein
LVSWSMLSIIDRIIAVHVVDYQGVRRHALV